MSERRPAVQAGGRRAGAAHFFASGSRLMTDLPLRLSAWLPKRETNHRTETEDLERQGSVELQRYVPLESVTISHRYMCINTSRVGLKLIATDRWRTMKPNTSNATLERSHLSSRAASGQAVCCSHMAKLSPMCRVAEGRKKWRGDETSAWPQAVSAAHCVFSSSSSPFFCLSSAVSSLGCASPFPCALS